MTETQLLSARNNLVTAGSSLCQSPVGLVLPSGAPASARPLPALLQAPRHSLALLPSGLAWGLSCHACWPSPPRQARVRRARPRMVGLLLALVAQLEATGSCPGPRALAASPASCPSRGRAAPSQTPPRHARLAGASTRQVLTLTSPSRGSDLGTPAFRGCARDFSGGGLNPVILRPGSRSRTTFLGPQDT